VRLFNVFSEYAYKSKTPPAGDKTLRGRGFSLSSNIDFIAGEVIDV
jgi:hypothetical protein